MANESGPGMKIILLDKETPTVIASGKQPKSKAKKPKLAAGSLTPTSPESELGGSLRRKPSVKKNTAKEGSVNIGGVVNAQTLSHQHLIDPHLSSVESPPLTSPYDTGSLYSNAMAAHHQVDLLGGNKQPPSYEDCIKNAQSIQSLQNMNNMENYGYSIGSPFQDIMNAQRAANGHSVQMGEQGLSPPYSNQSPPHSVQSNIALSPHAYLGSPSPAKSRPSLPTSPTHIQAMRHAMSQQNSPVKLGLISPTGSDMGMMVQQQQQNSAIMPQSMQLGGLEFGSAGLDLNGFCGSPDSFSGQIT